MASSVAGGAGSDILILSNYYAPEPTGSAPPITDLAEWLAENGHAPRVVTARPSYPDRRVFSGYERGQRDREVLNGVQIRRLWTYVPRGAGALARLLSEMSFAAGLVWARASGAVKAADAVICVCPSIFTVLTAPIFRRPGGRLLAIVHDIQSGLAQALRFNLGPAAAGLRALERSSLNRCEHVLTLSNQMNGVLQGMGVSRRITVVPPQIDTRKITPLPLAAEYASTIAYSGNLGRKQGLDQVLNLARELKARGSDICIVIRGQGSERERLQREAEKDRLSNLRFEPLASATDLNERLSRAAIYLVPQEPQGAEFAVPSKVFSAMAAGRPFVGTAQVGSPLHELALHSGAGLCVAPDDPAALGDVIVELLNRPDTRSQMGRFGRSFVEDNVDRNIVCARVAALAVSEGEPPG